MGHLFWLAFIKGYTTTTGLIMAIGMQNAFILRQGLLKSHLFLVAAVASIIDIVMIIIGVQGLGVIITSNPYLMDIAKYGGILFLFLYGCKCFYSAIFKFEIMRNDVSGKKSIKLVITALLASSFLNPHMYLDIMLIGAVGAGMEENLRGYYIIGAIIGSISWFFALSYGAAFFSPIFKKPISWKILDVIIGLLMWSIAFSMY